MRIAISSFSELGMKTLQFLSENMYQVVAISYCLPISTIVQTFNQQNYPDVIEIDGNYLSYRDQKIIYLQEKKIGNLPWSELGIDVVIDCQSFSNQEEAQNQADLHIKTGFGGKVILGSIGTIRLTPVKEKSSITPTIKRQRTFSQVEYQTLKQNQYKNYEQQIKMN